MDKRLDIDLYSLMEIAESCSVSLSTLRNAIKSNKLKARKIGREYKCTKGEIMKFLHLNEN
jgi:excisionase family DNA binding protein